MWNGFAVSLKGDKIAYRVLDVAKGAEVCLGTDGGREKASGR